MDSKFDYITVKNVPGELSAHVVKIYLESQGISCMMNSETYFNLYLGVQSPYSIVVPAGFAPRARKLLQGENFDLVTTVPKKSMVIYAIGRILSLLIVNR